MEMSDIPGPCQCGHPIHGAVCFFCACSSYDEDDGTDGPTSMPGPNYSADPYHGYYNGKKYAL